MTRVRATRVLRGAWVTCATAITVAACTASTPSAESLPDVTFTDQAHLMMVGDRAGGSPPARVPPPGAHLPYHGRKVVQNARVTQILYGSGSYIPELTSPGGANMASAYEQMLSSGVFDWLTEYGTASPA